MTNAIETKNLTKVYKNFTAVNSLNLEIPEKPVDPFGYCPGADPGLPHALLEYRRGRANYLWDAGS